MRRFTKRRRQWLQSRAGRWKKSESFLKNLIREIADRGLDIELTETPRRGEDLFWYDVRDAETVTETESDNANDKPRKVECCRQVDLPSVLREDRTKSVKNIGHAIANLKRMAQDGPVAANIARAAVSNFVFEQARKLIHTRP